MNFFLLDEIVTPQMMSEYMTSAKSVMVTKVINEQPKVRLVPTMEEFVSLRNFLIVNIILTNGSRAGGIIQMLHNHVITGKKTSHDQNIYSVCFIINFTQFVNFSQFKIIYICVAIVSIYTTMT